MIRKRLFLVGATAVAAVTLAFGAARLAYAAEATTTMAVTATVVSTCVVQATPLAFGNYNGSAPADTDAQSSISVTCTSGVPYEVGLDGGGSGDVNSRQMSLDADTLDYQIFQDSARTQNWGNTPTVDTVSGTGSGAADLIDVFGRIPAGQSSAATGAYADTVLVTVTF